MEELLNFMDATTGGLFVPVMAIAVSVLSLAMSVASIVLMKKTNERDNARIAQENAER